MPPPGFGPPGLDPMLGLDFFAMRKDFMEAYFGGFETDTTSFDEEVELLGCEKDLVEAAVELGTTTSAEDDLLTTDADLDDEDDARGFNESLVSIVPKYRPLLHRPSRVANAVIEEEDEEDASENDPASGIFEADSTQVRGRLWAQSLLRLRRSIDEIYLLCEFESDDGLTEQVQWILKQAGQDFGSLQKQLESQQEYALQGEYPMKAGVAWTTRPCKGGESMAEQFEKVQLTGSPVNSSKTGVKDTGKRTSSREGRRRGGAWLEEFEGDSNLSDVTPLSASLEDRPDGKDETGRESEKAGKDRSSQLYFMVQSTLENVHKRLGSASKPSPQEVQQRHETRQKQAQARRAVQDEERQLQLRQAESRAVAARERRQELEMRRQRDLLEKMTRARRQYQDQLRVICQRAHKENRKAHEVAFLAKEALKEEREMLKQKQENARVSRKMLRDQMQQKFMESAARVAKVSEKRKQQLETWQEKVQQELEEKERLASERRRERMNSIKLKSQGHETRSEIVQRKRRELQEVDERTTQEFLRFRNKNIGKMALDCDGLPEAVREEVDAIPSKPQRRKATSSNAGRGRSIDSPLAYSEPVIVETSGDFEEDPSSPREVPKFAAKRASLREELMAVALSDEEALRLACDSDLHATQNAAQRAKINKLAADLAKLMKTTAASSEDAHCGCLNLEKTEAVLSEFCKVLSQVQREADHALILKLKCARMVVDICCYVKDSIASLDMSGDKAPLVAWKQNCNVMLCALKWLGLLCKSRMARLVLLLTGRVVVLADVATAYLEMHFADALKPQELEGGPALFLPQLLHVLALHMKQVLPDGAREVQGTLTSYLLLGLAEKLRELFGRAELRGLKFFEGTSPLPLLLLRAMCFLGTLVCAYRTPKADDTHREVLEMLRDTELFGVVGILVSILMSEGRREKGQKLPQTVISLCVQAVRILNHIARIDLATVQKTLGASRQQEFYHLLVALLDYCVARLPASMVKPGPSGQAEESDLLHEAVVLLGFYCLQEPENQSILCYGEGQALLARLASLPLYYFMDERGKAILFPTILASCFKSEQNLEVLRSEMNMSLVHSFLAAQMKQGREEVPGLPGFATRFPPQLWEDALAFFDAPA